MLEANQSATILSGLVSSLHYPKQFEPGTRWDYGVGIDWLGRVVEKVDGRRINRFLREKIFDPLDMPDKRFEVEPNMAPRLASVGVGGEDGHSNEPPFDTSLLRDLAASTWFVASQDDMKASLPNGLIPQTNTSCLSACCAATSYPERMAGQSCHPSTHVIHQWPAPPILHSIFSSCKSPFRTRNGRAAVE